MNALTHLRNMITGTNDTLLDVPDYNAAPVDDAQTVQIAIPDTLDGINERLAELPDEERACQRQIEAAELRRNHAADDVRTYMAQAAARTLKDTSKLAEAIARAEELKNDTAASYIAHLHALGTERDALHQALKNAERKAVQQRYTNALHAYIRACREPIRLAKAVRETSEAAGVLILDGGNFKHLLPGALYLNGAEVDPFSPAFDAPAAAASHE
jgi:seryl-tRNA synthetase